MTRHRAKNADRIALSSQRQVGPAQLTADFSLSHCGKC
jgi:hypothetical protein